MESASNSWMQSAGIAQHEFVKNPSRSFPELSSVYRGRCTFATIARLQKQVWA
jgi:hypothetical protein